MRFEGKPVYLACGHTDMRKSINGSAAIVEGSFKLNPFDSAVFIFCSRNQFRHKARRSGFMSGRTSNGMERMPEFTKAERSGVCEDEGRGRLLAVLQAAGEGARWPEEGDGATMNLTSEELTFLLGGAKIELKLSRREVTGRRAV